MTSDDLIAHNRYRTLHSLGIFWVIYGVIRLIVGIWLVSFSNTATLMFGALLGRVPDPITMMNWFHVLYTLIVVLSVICGVLGIFAGIALFAGQRSGHTLGLFVGILSLPNLPLGTTLGIYSLVVLLPLGASTTAVVLERSATDLKRHPAAM